MNSQTIMRAYLLSLFAVYTEGYIYFYLPEENQVYWYHVSEIEQMIEDALRFKDKTVFVSVHPSTISKTSRKRALRDDISGIVSVFLDFDIANSKAHAQTALPDTQAELNDFLYEISLKDKISLYLSGHGVHGYAHLNKPFFIESEDDRKLADSISKGLSKYVQEQALKLRGWKFDNVGSLEHVARLPGSYNHKTGTPILVRPIAITDYKFSIDELKALVPQSHKDPIENTSGELWNPEREQSDKKADFNAVMAGCAFIRHCVNKAATLPEPEWHKFITIAARCKNGEVICHRASKPYPKYDFQETAQKIAATIASGAGPVTCRYIRDEIGFDGCRNCPSQVSSIKTPLTLGFIEPYLASLFARFVYDLETKRFYEINPMEVCK